MATPKAALLSSEWMDTEETLNALGIRRRTLQEWAQNGFLKFKRAPREGRRPERVYSAADVRRIEREGRPASPARNNAENPRLPAPRRLPPPANTPPLALALPDKSIALLNQLVEHWVQATKAPAVLPVTEKLWLTLDEAAAYSGLARGDLKRLVQEEKLTARKSGGWKILRKSLEAFEQ